MIPDYRMLTFDIGLKTFAFRNILGKSRLEQINHTYPFYVMEVFFLLTESPVGRKKPAERKGRSGVQGAVPARSSGPWKFCHASGSRACRCSLGFPLVVSGWAQRFNRAGQMCQRFCLFAFFFFNEASASNKLVFILNVDI